MVDRQPSTINNSILRSNYTISMAKIFHPIALFFIICDNIIIFATAWVLVPTSFSHNRRRRSTGRSHHLDVSPSPSSLILHTIHHQSRSPSSSSRVLRWYHVHDNDSDAAKKSVDLSLVKKQRQNNNKQNIFLDDSINDGEEEKNKNEPQFYHNNDDDTTKLNLRILLIDNHDSYTYNLYQYISTMTIHPVHVIMNDAYSSYAEFIISLGDNIGSTSIPTSTNNNIINSTTIFNDATSDTSPTPSPLHLDQYFDCIILSPGPGQPSHPTDMGIVLETIRKNDKLPILGVCLGHQALGYVYGKEVKLSPCGPVHGLMSSVMFHDDSSSSSSSNNNSNWAQSQTMLRLYYRIDKYCQQVGTTMMSIIRFNSNHHSMSNSIINIIIHTYYYSMNNHHTPTTTTMLPIIRQHPLLLPILRIYPIFYHPLPTMRLRYTTPDGLCSCTCHYSTYCPIGPVIALHQSPYLP